MPTTILVLTASIVVSLHGQFKCLPFVCYYTVFVEKYVSSPTPF